MADWTEYILHGNTVLNYVMVALGIIVGVIVLYGIRRIVLRILSRRLAGEENAQRLAFWQRLTNRVLYPISVVLLAYSMLKLLNMNELLLMTMNIVFWAALASSMGSGLSQLLVSFFTKYSFAETGDQEKANAIHWMTVFLKIIIWSVAFILFLDNMNVKITSLVTLLATGGIVFAFAAQAILGDVFCFVSILLDKPFEMGDFVAVGPVQGTVEHIGLKTTRLRSLDGEQVVLSNTDITGSRLQNFKTLTERRVLFRIGVVYDTPYQKLEKVPDLMREIIGAVPGATFSRAHFTAYRESSLEFEVVYFIQGSDYVEYLDIHHMVNLKIAEVFQREGISFAFPTRDIRVSGMKPETEGRQPEGKLL